jgi:hypothetical protein
MDCEDTMERVDIGLREQEANKEGIKFSLNLISKVNLYCEHCGMEASSLCRVNHPKKCFIYFEDFEKCMRSLEEWVK